MHVGSSVVASANVPSGQSGGAVERAGAQVSRFPLQPNSTTVIRRARFAFAAELQEPCKCYRETVHGSAATT